MKILRQQSNDGSRDADLYTKAQQVGIGIYFFLLLIQVTEIILLMKCEQ